MAVGTDLLTFGWPVSYGSDQLEAVGTGAAIRLGTHGAFSAGRSLTFRRLCDHSFPFQRHTTPHRLHRYLFQFPVPGARLLNRNSCRQTPCLVEVAGMSISPSYSAIGARQVWHQTRQRVGAYGTAWGSD